MGLSHYHRTLLMTIYGTYDQVKDIPAHEWNDHSFYDERSGTYNLFGHYLRLTGLHPESISHTKAMTCAAPLASAINYMMDQLIDYVIWDAYAMIEGKDSMFEQPGAKQRALAVLQRIETEFPRDKYAIPVDDTTHDGPEHLPLGRLNRMPHVPHAHKI